MGRFSPSRTTNAGAQTSRFAAPSAVGAGFNTATKIQTRIRKINDEIITTILVDIQTLLVSTTVKDVIGEDGAAAAFMTRVTTAKNGIIYKIEMGCIETPAGSNTTADIDLVSNSAALAEDATFDGTGAGIALITAGGNWTTGMYKVSPVDTDLSALVNDRLYLANGSGANSGGTYTAGKFIIKLYGASF